MFMSLICLEITFVYKIRIKLHSFSCGYPVVQASFVEDIVIFLLNGINIFVEKMYDRLFVDTQF